MEIDGIEYNEINGYIYRADCEDCNGNGMLWDNGFYNPPSQCDCGQVEPKETTDETD